MFEFSASLFSLLIKSSATGTIYRCVARIFRAKRIILDSSEFNAAGAQFFLVVKQQNRKAGTGRKKSPKSQIIKKSCPGNKKRERGIF